MKKLLAILALGAMGCVHARVAQPIAIKQPADMELSCEQLVIEYKTNTDVAAKKIEKNENSDSRDFWLGVFVWPGLMDLQNADGNEGNALLDRNIYLQEVARPQGYGQLATTAKALYYDYSNPASSLRKAQLIRGQVIKSTSMLILSWPYRVRS